MIMNLSLQIEINALKERNKVLGEHKTGGLDWGWREGFPSKVTLELELTGRRVEEGRAFHTGGNTSV